MKRSLAGRAFYENKIQEIFINADYPDNIITGIKELGFEHWFGDGDEQIWAIKRYCSRGGNGKFLLLLNFINASWWLYERASMNNMPGFDRHGEEVEVPA